MQGHTPSGLNKPNTTPAAKLVADADDVATGPAYVDDRELARRTPLSRATYQKLRRTGGGPPYSRCGARIVYSWADVQAWIAANQVREAA